MTRRSAEPRSQPSMPGTGCEWPIRSVPGNALLIAAVVFVVFGPALSAGYIWDDSGHITYPELRSWSGLFRIWFEVGVTQQYYPLLHTAFWIEHRLWGDAAVGYHVINTVWHALSAVLLGLVLRRLALPCAWFAALLFAVHPVCVESVAWISEQKNTLSLALLLSAALAYLRFDDEREAGSYATATGLFVLALLTKTVTATLPAALLVVFWWRRGRLDGRRDIVPLLPWFALAIVGGVVTAWFEHSLIGAKGEDFAFGPVERVLLAGRVVWFYLGKLLWPAPLLFVYERWEIDAAAWWQYLFPAAALLLIGVLAVLAFRFGRRGPLAVTLLYGGMLFPVLGFFNVYPFNFSFVADHFQYHASTAIYGGLAGVLPALVCRVRPVAVRVAGVLLLGGLGFIAWKQCHLYKNEIALFEATLSENPDSWMAHNNLGIALVGAGRTSEALPHYREALRLRPNMAEAENNLGYALKALGRPAEAVPHLRRAIELWPGFREAQANLGEALMLAGRQDEALAVFAETASLHPQDADAQFNHGLTLAKLGRTEEALRYFESADRIRPDDAKFVLHLGTALQFVRGLDAALPHIRRAIELNPGMALAHYTLGQALAQNGRYSEAIAPLKEAVRLEPRLIPAYHELAGALDSLGRIPEADHYRAEAARRESAR